MSLSIDKKTNRLIQFIQVNDCLEIQLKSSTHSFYIRQDHLLCYLRNLLNSNTSDFIERHTLPIFEEELMVDFSTIRNRHLESLMHFLNENVTDNLLDQLSLFLSGLDFEEILIVMGIRKTPATLTNELALPPTKEALKLFALAPYNNAIKVATRAWEKHVGRNKDHFWGILTGTPKEREVHVLKIIDQLLDNHHWWNVFTHYKHGCVYEIRSKSGHGMRWSIENNEFIGFVEPFTK